MSDLKTNWNAGDAGHVAATNDIATRVNKSIRSVHEFGTDGAAIQSACTAGGSWFIPAGTYTTAVAITMPAAVSLYGEHGSIIQATAALTNLLSNEATGLLIRLSGIQLDGNGFAQTCLELENVNNHNDGIFGIECDNALADGIILTRCQGGTFQGMWSHNNGGAGIVLQGCNAASVWGIRANANAGDGVQITNYFDAINYSGGHQNLSLLSEGNGGHGVLCQDLNSLMRLQGGWVEANTLDGVRGDNCTLTQIIGMRISGAGSDTNRAILLADTGSGPYVVRDNFVARSSGNVNYAVVDDQNANVNSVIETNYDGSFVLL